MARGMSNKSPMAKTSGMSKRPVRQTQQAPPAPPTEPPGAPSLATLLPYPALLSGEECNVHGIFCYIIEHYGNEGIAILIQHYHGAGSSILVGDWSGQVIDLTDSKHPLQVIAQQFLSQHGLRLIQLTHLIKLPQCILYVAARNKPVLVDVRVSLNKFAGPGMLRDVFGKVVETQHVIDVKVLDDAVYHSIQSGAEPFASDVIVKPSRFRCSMVGQTAVPIYVEFRR